MSNRTLKITKPPMSGDDVSAWRREVISQFHAWKIAIPLKETGPYDSEVRKWTRSLLYNNGYSTSLMDKGVTPGLRSKVRNKRRTAAEQARFLARKNNRAAIRKRYPLSKAGKKPKIYRLALSGDPAKYGSLGPFIEPLGHYTAGPRDTSDAHAFALDRQYHEQHKAQGWGFIGYHLNITSAGTIVLLRPTRYKGAHVAGHNTGRIGIMVHGSPGQRMTQAQRDTLQWLMDHGHTSAMPESHRFPAKPKQIHVHNDLNATDCPGDFEADYKGVKL